MTIDPYAVPTRHAVAEVSSLPRTHWRWLAYALGLTCIVLPVVLTAAMVMFSGLDFRISSYSEGVATGTLVAYVGAWVISGALLCTRSKAALWTLTFILVVTALLVVGSRDWEVGGWMLGWCALHIALAAWLRNRRALV